MSKIVKVSDDDYRIVVKPGGTITLDTGDNAGGVVVTGNLAILGAVFDITTENTVVRDNIILLNGGEVGPGITRDGRSGIEIDRGPGTPNVSLLFEENLSGPGYTSAFVFKNTSNQLQPVVTNRISNGTQNLFLGNGVLTIEGTSGYETRVVNDNNVPNKKYVDDAISNATLQLTVNNIVNETSLLSLSSSSSTGLQLTFNGALQAQWTNTFHRVQNVRITGNQIEPATLNTDLVLRSPGTGHVTVDDSMRIKKVAFTPPAVSDSTIIYAKDSGRGESGIYFTSSDNNTGELISARRALAFSVIF
jgi:hypothetical protein